MPSWGDLLGSGSIIETIVVWGVLNQLIGDLLGPVQELVRQKVNSANPDIALAPADLADAVVRGILTQAAAEGEAAKSGINADRFNTMRHLAGEPIGLQEGLEAVRRGFMPSGDAGLESPSLERLVLQSRYFDMWLPVIEKLAEVPITVGEAVDALLRGQTDRATAEAEAFASGINAQRFQILLDSAGRPPGPMELVTLMRRGLIPRDGVGPQVVSFQQGIYEGDSKDKWWTYLAELATAVPPPRTVANLVKTGSLTDAQAVKYFQDAGLDPGLSAAYLHSAKGEKLAGSKHLAQGAVVTLYEAGAIDQAAAVSHLNALGYDDADAGLVLELADYTREVRAVTSAINRVHNLYVAHKITRHAAGDGLGQLGVTGVHADRLLATWDHERAANIKPLTEAQITAAWEYQILTEAEALAELEAIGLTPFDAWVAMSVKAKGPIPGRPARGPGGPGVT